MDSKLLKILTGVAAVGTIGAPMTAFASPVTTEKAENTNTETTATTSDVKTTDQALAETKAEAKTETKQDTVKSEDTSSEAKTETTEKASAATDKASVDNATKVQTENQTEDQKSENTAASSEDNTNNESTISADEINGYISTADMIDDLDKGAYADLDYLASYAGVKKPEGVDEKAFAAAQKKSEAAAKRIEVIKKSAADVSKELTTLDFNKSENLDKFYSDFCQLTPQAQDYIMSLTVRNPSLGNNEDGYYYSDILMKDPEVKPLIEKLNNAGYPLELKDFIKLYNKLSNNKKVVVKGYSSGLVDSYASEIIYEAGIDAQNNNKSNSVKNFLKDFHDRALYANSEDLDRLAKEYLNLSKDDQNYVKEKLEGAYEYFGLDAAVAKAQKSQKGDDTKDSDKDQNLTDAQKEAMKPIIKQLSAFDTKITPANINQLFDLVDQIDELTPKQLAYLNQQTNGKADELVDLAIKFESRDFFKFNDKGQKPGQATKNQGISNNNAAIANMSFGNNSFGTVKAGSTLTSASPKTGDTTDALAEVLTMIAGIGGMTGLGLLKIKKDKKALQK